MASVLQLRELTKLPIREIVVLLRQNHAFEHATINLLSRRYPAAQVMGFSGPLGFTLHASLMAEQVIPTVREALASLKAGHVDLAVHENCGTNLVVTALLTTLATVVGLGSRGLPGRRDRRTIWRFLERLPRAVLLSVAALTLSAPLGRWIQANVTTNPDLRNIEIASIFTDYHSGLLRVRVHTRRVDELTPAQSGAAA